MFTLMYLPETLRVVMRNVSRKSWPSIARANLHFKWFPNESACRTNYIDASTHPDFMTESQARLVSALLFANLRYRIITLSTQQYGRASRPRRYLLYWSTLFPCNQGICTYPPMWLLLLVFAQVSSTYVMCCFLYFSLIKCSKIRV